MKILFFTDLHLRRTPPRWRRDNYAEALLRKLEFIVDLAKTEDCDRVYFGGDFVDSPQVSIALVNQAVDTLSELTANGIGFTAAFGQHDEQGNIPKGIEASVTSLLYRIPNNNLPPIGIDIGFAFNDTMVLHYRDILLELIHYRGDFYNPSDNTAIEIDMMLIHTMITPKAVPWPHILISDIPTGASIVLSGDYHPGFPPIFSNDTWFINPGAIARTTVADADKLPKVAIVDTDKLPNNPAEYVEVECAPAHEAFDLEGAEAVKELDSERSQYTRMLQDMAESGGQKSWEAMLERAAREGEAGQDVIEEAKRRCESIEEAQNE